MKIDPSSVLCMSEAPRSRQTVRRHYLAWRSRQGLPERCDNPCCMFFQSPLMWNGRRLPLILDHASGNARDNRVENLRLLCPNCDSQNDETRGGANAGRIEVLPGGSYHVRSRNGTQAAYANGATFSAGVALHAGIASASVSESNPPLETGADDA